MIDYAHNKLYKETSIPKYPTISGDGFTFSHKDMYSNSLELTESLCSESTLRFGCCEASKFKVRILNNVLSLTGKEIIVSETLKGGEDTPFILGHYKVFSDKPTADRKYRDIVAYDAMYDIINADVAAWYNTILPEADSTVTLKEFRDSFLAYFGIEQEDTTLVNDFMTVTKTIEPTKLSGKTVITAICEINGCFGHIGRDGSLQYIHLKEMAEGLYPSDTLYPADDLYPRDPLNAELISKSHYISATYEDFTTAKINKLLIRKEEDDAGYPYGTGDNCYVVQDNFLVYGKSEEELEVIAANMYSVIHKLWYRPAHVEAKGNPCLEVGDGIRLSTRYEIIYTYILQRTLKGIQALRDTYDAEGEQYQSEKVNSTREQIIQLKGKTNKLTRTLEETRSEIIDMERGLSTRITQNATDITLEATRAEEAEEALSASIKVNADNINLKVSKNNIISEINQTAENITISAQKIDLVGLVEADELTAKYATLEHVYTTTANIEYLISQKADLTELNVVQASIESLSANKASVTDLAATNTNVTNLTSRTANLEDAIINKADISSLNAVQAQINSLSVNTTETDLLFNKNALFYNTLAISSSGKFIFKGKQVYIQAVNGVNCLVVGADTT